MRKKDAYPQRWDLYLLIYKSEDGSKTMANISAFKGRKSRECPPRFSFTPGTRLAALHQVEVNSQEDLVNKIATAAKDWMQPFEWEPALVDLINNNVPSHVGVTTDHGECPPQTH